MKTAKKACIEDRTADHTAKNDCWWCDERSAFWENLGITNFGSISRRVKVIATCCLFTKVKVNQQAFITRFGSGKEIGFEIATSFRNGVQASTSEPISVFLTWKWTSWVLTPPFPKPNTLPRFEIPTSQKRPRTKDLKNYLWAAQHPLRNRLLLTPIVRQNEHCDVVVGA